MMIALLLCLTGCAWTRKHLHISEHPFQDMKRGFENMHMPHWMQKHKSPIAHAIDQLEKAHGLNAWRAKQAFSCDLSSDGETPIQGTLTFTTDGSRSRIDLADGIKLIFDGEHAWVWPAPAMTRVSMPRFHLRNWPFFIAAPFRLHDSGITIREGDTLPLGGRSIPTLRLDRSEVGFGNDWYILYPDPENGRLRAVAYLSTYGKRPGETSDARAIVYSDFVTIEGVTLPSRWTLYKWSEEAGITGDPIGRASLKNIQFITPPAGFFNKPADAKEDPPPATQP
jgi:hypothetical protein